MRNRLRALVPSTLDESQRTLYDNISGGARGTGGHFPLVDDEGGLTGPFNAMLLSPTLGDPLQRLGSAIRYRSRLGDRAREIAILLVARHNGSGFERQAHEKVALAVGLSGQELEAIQSGDFAGSDSEEAWVLIVVRELLATGNVADATYRDAVIALSEPWLFELTTLVGYYSLLAMQLKVFGVDS
jgi:4-carboxymuconolactone decarboxylase